MHATSRRRRRRHRLRNPRCCQARAASRRRGPAARPGTPDRRRPPAAKPAGLSTLCTRCEGRTWQQMGAATLEHATDALHMCVQRAAGVRRCAVQVCMCGVMCGPSVQISAYKAHGAGFAAGRLSKVHHRAGHVMHACIHVCACVCACVQWP